MKTLIEKIKNKHFSDHEYFLFMGKKKACKLDCHLNFYWSKNRSRNRSRSSNSVPEDKSFFNFTSLVTSQVI